MQRAMYISWDVPEIYSQHFFLPKKKMAQR